MSARGLRDLGQGPESILDRDELKSVRRIGLRVLASAFATSVIGTLLLVVYP